MEGECSSEIFKNYKFNPLNFKMYERQLSSKSVNAVHWMNIGLNHFFGFNHYEAIRCFKEAIKFDSECLFIYWGIAYFNGPHYNKMSITEDSLNEAYHYIKIGKEKITKDSPQIEIDLLNSLELRYPKKFEFSGEEFQKQLICFNLEMEKLYNKYNNDLDITAVYVESIMNLRPWCLWKIDGTPYPEAIKAREILEKNIKTKFHPLLSHLYIHLLELSPFMKDALDVADELYCKSEGVGHLLHMPSHIYIQLGMYKKSIESNVKAILADQYLNDYVNKFTFFTFYRAHNIHFLIWTYMFIGDYESSIQNIELLENLLSEDIINKIGNDVEFFLMARQEIYIRFGKWKEILEFPLEKRSDFSLCQTIQRFARGIAYAVLNDTQKALEEKNVFDDLRKKIPSERRIGSNPHSSVLDVADQMLLGEIYYRKKEFDKAFDFLRKSVKLCDGLIYDEPWDWMQPPRHALGALLLEQKHYEESEKVYLEDLKTYQKNVWSLSGLYEIYTVTSQHDKLKLIETDYKEAIANSKVEISRSCFCKGMFNN